MQQSTTAGENLVIEALGIPAGGGRIVTDVLHFQGSLYTYSQLAKRGMDVVVLPQKDWRIRLEDLDAAVTKETRLVGQYRWSRPSTASSTTSTRCARSRTPRAFRSMPTSSMRPARSCRST